jgi:hypothetical protein
MKSQVPLTKELEFSSELDLRPAIIIEFLQQYIKKFPEDEVAAQPLGFGQKAKTESEGKAASNSGWSKIASTGFDQSSTSDEPVDISVSTQKSEIRHSVRLLENYACCE